MNTIGKNIRLLRQHNEWSQGEVAKKLGISIPAFSKIETGITDVNISRLDQIAKLFEVSIIDLIIKGSSSQVDSSPEINMLREKLFLKEEEIISLQKKVISLYEEIKNNYTLKDLPHS
ncbi:MAG: helix-turn-helix transcriptional regulator [Bacteroidota bacterium]